ncbi:MAG TPA: hypothetical protein VN862_03270 [Candidatus Acidoferrales bacterium]|nr:hypothetical protein [Candidatus Acidoferrales bacterium]
MDKEEWIAQLGSSDAAMRLQGAAAIFAEAWRLSAPVLDRWTQDREFASLLLHHEVDGRPLRATAGVAVTRQNFANIRDANGSPRLADVPPDQDAEEFELHFAPVRSIADVSTLGPIHLDILTTKNAGGQGAIANFLRKFGEGIQQVEFEVEDIDRATRILDERFSQRAIYPQTRAGADGTRVNFFLANCCVGRKLLVELVEPKGNSG